MNPTTRAYVYLHIAVLLWGVTAILGKMISFNEYVLVWYRMGLVTLSFLVFRKAWQGVKELSHRQAMEIGAVGIIVSLHWITFYGAIKYANVSVALSVMATMSFMTSLIEPVVTGRRFQWYESLLGLLVIPGVYLIFCFSDASYTTGMLMAFVSAFLAALFTSINKRLVEYTNAYAFSLVQISAGFLFLTLLLPVYLHWFPSEGSWYSGVPMDAVYLVLLALVCTTLPMLLYLVALRQLNAFITNLTNNLEPVYGILLAWIIFRENEDMDMRFYLGSAIILMSIFLQPLLKRYFAR